MVKESQNKFTRLALISKLGAANWGLELRNGCSGQYRYEDGTFVMGEGMAKDLDKLMTDTQFWFQLELE
ncbi:hypothetical protein Pst134EA_032368 [Puccinia striiformis f. sp. tritici]|uniref:uncharacterized protein n=1 Tax=Puccinia striiformis f. sp. tritici TaxID=168172 RepID=UPI00200825C1|nr:uncharacterized protein Pst134EA_032368 [Puccinia striiformis f. sp. tritici]KAH9441763.1 hypothetical protein Pst134EA_032368 [Puccinia striiformis f. sp. tritici]